MYKARVQDFIFNFFWAVDLFYVGLSPRRYQKHHLYFTDNQQKHNVLLAVMQQLQEHSTYLHRSLFNTLLTIYMISCLECSTSSSTLYPLYLDMDLYLYQLVGKNAR